MTFVLTNFSSTNSTHRVNTPKSMLAEITSPVVFASLYAWYTISKEMNDIKIATSVKNWFMLTLHGLMSGAHLICGTINVHIVPRTKVRNICFFICRSLEVNKKKSPNLHLEISQKMKKMR